VSNDESAEDERDVAWLLAQARGDEAPPPDPVRAAEYLRLEEALCALPPLKAPASEPAPTPPRRLAAEPATLRRPTGRSASPRLGWRVYALPVAAVLALAAIFLFFVGRPPSSDESFEVAFERGAARARTEGGSAAVGDVLVVKAQPTGGGELRVYRDRRELALRCPNGAGCSEVVEGGRLTLQGKLPLEAPGSYRVVLLNGAHLPPPAGGEDDDLKAATAAGATFETKLFSVE
jgi:hypothetical protein